MTRTTLLLLIVAGSAHAAEPTRPEPAPLGTMPSRHIAHIYYNMGTGEKIAVPLGDARPADNGVSPAVWIADNTLPCTDFGQNALIVGVMDDPTCTTCADSTATRVIFLDWGDIRADTIVDCVGVEWASCVFDQDSDGDGIGDGVAGFAATWTWYDQENGFDSSATRLPIMGFTLTDLPGSARGNFPCEVFARYTATVDLAAGFGSSIAFEIGDTDSNDGSGTGLFNPGAGVDLDTDGFVDFGYSLQYTQPGTADLDGDGVIDGVPDDAPRGPEPLTGWSLTTGNGHVTQDGSAYLPETDTPGAIGIEDAFDMFIDTDSDGEYESIGTFFYGGFACDIDGNGRYEPGLNSNPYAQFYMKLYGPSACGCCPADIHPPQGSDGVINFFDLVEYLARFQAADPLADLFPPPSGDGEVNFFDLGTYLAYFNAGCP